ncbi:uridine/cytidine kinase [Malassezia vespertilionis]|uniref:uridine/cytidine kinase n=1 Tax=Malassezia vespertilionis TaxID=2020962 RepID=UPI0024B1F2DB|nr:uridine/cytidine kinase [Malassezia vespertilionis]WFD05196.1 uridine/cytidine kinase [Malassezia vespertilionis]
MQTYLVGVAGGSASGKTSIAKEILHQLPHVPWVAIVSQDAFYRPLTLEQTELAYKGQFDFDHPSAIDQELLVHCISELKRSRAANIPVYSFTHHQRTTESTYLYGQAVIVLEGIFALHDPALRAMLDLKIFVQTDPDIMLARRIRRDIVDRGRSVEGVLDQYLRFVKPSFDTFVGPLARYADIIVPGSNNGVAIEVISQHIAKHLKFTPKFPMSAQLSTDIAWEASRYPTHRVLIGTTESGAPAHLVERESPPLPPPPIQLKHVEQTLPLPPNVSVLPQTAQLAGLLTTMHDLNTHSGVFSSACKRVGSMVVEAAMCRLPYRTRTVQLSTGGEYDGLELDVQHICAVSVLRSGEILEKPLRRALPALALGSLLIQSSDSNYRPLLYTVSLPEFLRVRSSAENSYVLLTEAQIGTGASVFMAVRVLLDHGVPEDHIIILSLLVSAKGGVWALQYAFPKVTIVTAGIDPGLQRFVWPATQNEQPLQGDAVTDAAKDRVVFAITPGCGQMGDRFWGT